MKCSTWNYSFPYRLLELAMLGCSNGNRGCMPTTRRRGCHQPVAMGFQLRGLTVPQSLPSHTARVFMLPCCCTPEALNVPLTWVVNSRSLRNVA